MNLTDCGQSGMIFVVIDTSCLAFSSMITNRLERMWKEELVD